MRQFEQERRGTDEKKMQIINELNSAVNQNESFKSQVSDLNGQLTRSWEEARELQSGLSQAREQVSQLTSANAKLREEAQEVGVHLNNAREQLRQRV